MIHKNRMKKNGKNVRKKRKITKKKKENIVRNNKLEALDSDSNSNSNHNLSAYDCLTVYSLNDYPDTK